MKKHKDFLLAFLLPTLLLCGCGPAVKPAAAATTETIAEQQEETVSASSPMIDDELKKQLDGKFKYEVTADAVTITRYTSFADTVNIPYGVTCIGDEAFAGCTSLTSVTIPDSVTCIGDSAFEGCTSLTEVWTDEVMHTNPDWSIDLYHPDTLWIGGDVFNDCHDDLVIYGIRDYVAEQYAKEHGIKFESRF